jgi:hypothetical protein
LSGFFSRVGGGARSAFAGRGFDDDPRSRAAEKGTTAKQRLSEGRVRRDRRQRAASQSGDNNRFFHCTASFCKRNRSVDAAVRERGAPPFRLYPYNYNRKKFENQRLSADFLQKTP